MAPMFYAFPEDSLCASDAAADQFMFGPSVLVAPIYTNCSANFSCTSRYVYLPTLPHGETWTNVFTSQSTLGGVNISIDGERDTFPLFTRGVHPQQIFKLSSDGSQ